MPMLEVRDREWIGTYFDYSNFTFPDGSEWAVFRKISEKALLFPSRSVTEESASQTDGSCGGDTEVISDDGIDDSYSDAGDLREDLNNTASESSLTRENLDKANASNDSFQHVTIEDTTNYFPGFGVSKFVHMHDEGQPAEAQAVYECYQVRGNDVGKWAIMKIRVQIQPDWDAVTSPQERARLATEDPAVCTYQELTTLRHLTEYNCSVVPKLLADDYYLQLSQEWIPGGYLVVMVMERVPGVSLREVFLSLSEEQADMIRASFRRTLTELYALKIKFYEPRIKNIFYDAAEDKCYIIDLERTRIGGSNDEIRCWNDRDLDEWSMGKMLLTDW